MSYKFKNRPGGCLSSLLVLPLAILMAMFRIISDAAKGKY